MEGLATYTLGELSINGKGSYGIGAPAVDFSENKYMYLRITDINDDGTLSSSDRKSVDDPDAHKYVLQKNDIVFARTGNSTGRAYFYDERDGELVYAGFLIKFSLDPAKVNPKILKYYTHSKPYYDWVKSFDTGATRGNINAQTFASMPIELPDRETQDRIVDILSAIDNKIRLNNRINHNLEEQAQALFDSFVASDNGFGYHQLSEIAVINPSRTLSKNTVARCIDMSFLSTSGTFPSGWEYKPYSGGMRFQNGDTIMARITPCLENGKAGYINFLDSKETAFGSTEYIVLSAKEGYPSEMFYFLTRNADFIDYAVKNMNGSSGRQRVSGETIGKYSLPVLTGKQLSDLQIHCSEAMKNICNNCLENRLLVSTRDSLLPKLMSGEITC